MVKAIDESGHSHYFPLAYIFKEIVKKRNMGNSSHLNSRTVGGIRGRKTSCPFPYPVRMVASITRGRSYRQLCPVADRMSSTYGRLSNCCFGRLVFLCSEALQGQAGYVEFFASWIRPSVWMGIVSWLCRVLCQLD